MAARRNMLPAELLSVVSLISLLLLAVSVRALGTLGTAAAGDVLEQVSVLLQLARVEAVTRGGVCSLEIDPRSGRARIVDGESGEVIHASRIDTMHRLDQTDRYGVELPAKPVEVAFDATGHPPLGTTGLRIRSEHADGAVWVDDGGEIVVEDFRGTEN